MSDGVRDREDSLRAILLGNSDLAAPDEGQSAVQEAHENAGTDRLGFGFVRNLGVDGDRVRLLYVVTDGTRDACIQTIIPGSLLPRLSKVDDIDEWVYERLYRRVEGAELDIAYDALLLAHPVTLRS